jgi:hypothetical protein
VVRIGGGVGGVDVRFKDGIGGVRENERRGRGKG